MGREQAESRNASTGCISASSHRRQYRGRLFKSDAESAGRHLAHSLEPDTEFDADPDCPTDSRRSEGKGNGKPFIYTNPNRHAYLNAVTDTYADCLGN